MRRSWSIGYQSFYFVLAENPTLIDFNCSGQYLDAFVSECLRLGPPLLSIDRVVTKDVQLGEYKLEKGVVVNLVFWINHISERFFPNPEKFDPSRFLDKSSSNPNQANRNDVYLPFSAGNR